MNLLQLLFFIWHEFLIFFNVSFVDGPMSDRCCCLVICSVEKFISVRKRGCLVDIANAVEDHNFADMGLLELYGLKLYLNFIKYIIMVVSIIVFCIECIYIYRRSSNSQLKRSVGAFVNQQYCSFCSDGGFSGVVLHVLYERNGI